MKGCCTLYVIAKETKSQRRIAYGRSALGASMLEAITLVALLTIASMVAIHALGHNNSVQIKVASHAIGGGTEGTMTTLATTHECPKSNPYCEDKDLAPPPEDGSSPD